DGAELPAAAVAFADVHRVAADDGLVRRRAEAGPTAHPPQRPLVGTASVGRQARRVGLFRAARGRRQLQFAIRSVGAARSRARRRAGRGPRLADDQYLLAAYAERRRLMGLQGSRPGPWLR